MKKSKSIFTDQKGDQGLWKSIKFVERRLPEAIVESEKLRLMDRIPQEEEPPVIPIRSRKKSPWISYAAASIVLLLSLGTFLVLKEESYETAYGQLLQLELPDGSSVTLNGNSSISYSPMVWKLFDSRKLKLTGEVFFDVAKKEKEGQSVKFQVLTRNLTIEVLGTRFNVIDRAGKESVVLEEGIVQLFLPQAEKPLEMLPGDYISYNSRISAMLRMKVQPEEYTSWKDKYIVLNNKTLGELAQIITSVYGKKVIFQNPGDKEIPLEGKVPSDEIKILITALHLVTKLDIKLKDDIVTISNSQEELTN